MKYFTKLKTKDIMSLAGFIVMGFAWILVDQVFLNKSSSRFVAFILLMTVLFFLQYVINKPQKIWHYANTIALILLIFVILSSIVMHVFIYHDFESRLKHSVLIWAITVAMPYATGFLYSLKKIK
jgi:hypothetical protein